MSYTVAADIAFVPKVWSDHALAYFDKKMAIGQLALVDKTLQSQPGETVTFPYWKAIGDVEEPAESAALSVDSLGDDSFSCTVKEVGKAVGWTDKSKRKGAGRDPEGEAQRQMGIKYAEHMDADLMTLIKTGGNYSTGLTASVAGDTLTVEKILEHLILGFGDKHNDAVAHAMHSFAFLDLMKAGGSGFLKSDVNDPFNGVPGFQGRILGRAMFTLDSIDRVTDVGSKKTYAMYSFKANPFGIYMAEELQFEKDRDILARKNVIASTMWYGVCSLHGKVSSDDKRVVRSTFTTTQGA